MYNVHDTHDLMDFNSEKGQGEYVFKRCTEIIVKLMLLVILILWVYFVASSLGFTDKEIKSDSACGHEDVVLIQNTLMTYSHLYAEPFYVDKDDVIDCLPIKGLDLNVTICIPSLQTDRSFSSGIRKGNLPEKDNVMKIKKFLEDDPGLGLIDLGANMGYYSLIAAGMGRNVIAVEPLSSNVQRLQRSVQVNNFTDRIQILRNAVSDKRSLTVISKNKDRNPGDTRIIQHYTRDIGYQCSRVGCEAVKTILMNDILPFVKFKKAIIKIDIQGFEHLAFQHAEKLFDAVYIPYILMEWGIINHHYISASHISEDKTKVIRMIDFLIKRGYVVRSQPEGKPLNIGKGWGVWTMDVLWIHTYNNTSIKTNVSR